MELAVAFVGDVDRVTGGAGHGRHDGAVVLEDGIDQGGLAGIRFADHRDLEPGAGDFLLRLAGGCRKGGEALVEEIEELVEIAPVGGRDGEADPEAEAGEVVGAEVLLRVVRLVEDETHATGRLAQLRGDALINRGEALPGIDEEEDEVGGLHRDRGLRGNRIGEVGVGHGANAAGVNQLAGGRGERARGRDAIASHPRFIVDNRDLPPGEAVEEGGLSDVRTSDEGDFGLMGGARHDHVPGVGGCPRGDNKTRRGRQRWR